MKIQITLLTLAAAFFMNFTGPVEKVGVDTTQSTVTWKAYKVTGSHEGNLELTSGSLEMQDGNLVGGEFVLNMASIVVTDLTGGSKGKLEGHLHSDDFFGTATYPTADLKITQVVSRGTAGSYKVTADLTVKGITNEIKFNTQITEENGQQVATADIVVDRSEYNVRYGSGSFFSNLGDNTIYDEFDISVKLVIQ